MSRIDDLTPSPEQAAAAAEALRTVSAALCQPPLDPDEVTGALLRASRRTRTGSWSTRDQAHDLTCWECSWENG